jgi:hypothetical protein
MPSFASLAFIKLPMIKLIKGGMSSVISGRIFNSALAAFKCLDDAHF